MARPRCTAEAAQRHHSSRRNCQSEGKTSYEVTTGFQLCFSPLCYPRRNSTFKHHRVADTSSSLYLSIYLTGNMCVESIVFIQQQQNLYIYIFFNEDVHIICKTLRTSPSKLECSEMYLKLIKNLQNIIKVIESLAPLTRDSGFDTLSIKERCEV